MADTPPSPRPFAGMRRGRDACTPPGTVVAVLEVQRFAALRRLIGYARANALMQSLADRLLALVPGAEIGRVGRTTIEFAFRAGDGPAAEQILADAVAPLGAPLAVEGTEFDLAVLIGAVEVGGRVIGDALVDAAAGALADARTRPPGVAFAAGTPAEDDSGEDIVLLRHLRRAAERGELELVYQPKLRARENLFTSAEALLRWHHPRFGTVPADRFIPLAEQAGAIGRLTDWVLARAIADQAALVAAGHHIEIYINLSGPLLADTAFARRALAAVAASSGAIGFEITETAVIADPETALRNLHAFRDAGIRIAIDDYGSGLSSLAYLKRLPAQELKIDRMFVSGLVNSHRDPLLVRSSIDLAHALEMEVTAEGVDDPVALSLLRVMGCDLLQGYLISPPLALPKLMALLGEERQAGGSGHAAPAELTWIRKPSARPKKEG